MKFFLLPALAFMAIGLTFSPWGIHGYDAIGGTSFGIGIALLIFWPINTFINKSFKND